MIPWLEAGDPFPPVELALRDPNGLLAAGDELSTERLVQAYERGIFPWFGDGDPVLWWSPDPRMVLGTGALKVSRSLRKTLTRFVRTPGCEVRIDNAFRRVINACSQTPREGQDGTWIVPEMVDAYCQWHDLGRVHSVETWIDGELVGGLYGASLGRMFFGESMFAHRTDASKIALAALVCFCREHAVPMIDCQQRTAHLASFGGREIERSEFESRLRAALNAPRITDWSYDLAMWRHLEVGGA